ncbi:PRC-barrel domain-containing protein [Fulvivirga ulvae]|uniref:PRC-barrel domain-containing protein n=1 Tax=Fulvivirga ulvae TaxID=2904245 RepID=UPI001F259389|nr:PRC-barrel domain-containing protein [Fulvivirga ulvae]UII31387.1 PRC-barrel domain-containing protein [Fulvivirga ulvae]
MNTQLISATTIEGTDVVNAKGENIGEIKDLMIDWENSTIAYAVLSFGGFLGFGEKLFAIPMEALEFDTSRQDTIILDIEKEHLENAPGFDKDEWPAHADRTFIDSIYKHYGYEPYWTRYHPTDY